MAGQRKKVVVGFLFAIFVISLLSIPLQGQQEIVTQLPKMLDTENLVAANPITIDGDDDWQYNPYVTGGPGNDLQHAWIISSLSITARNAQLIEILNTRDYFIIEQCTLDNGDLKIEPPFNDQDGINNT